MLVEGRKLDNLTPEGVAVQATEELATLADTDYSVFTVAQKRAIIMFASFIGLLSPMSGSIYYPALNSVSQV